MRVSAKPKQNPKLEYRNPKQIRMTEIRNRQRENKAWFRSDKHLFVHCFENLDFGFVSDFDIGIPDLKIGFW
jgi:hypothetical protein